MFVLILSFLIILSTLSLAMLGTILNKKPIQGTCGGIKQWSLDNTNGEFSCELCGAKKPQESCENVVKSSILP